MRSPFELTFPLIGQSAGSIAVASSLSPRRQSHGGTNSPRHMPAFAKRADEFLDQGNLDGQRLWMRIMQAIEELQRERPRDGEATH